MWRIGMLSMLLPALVVQANGQDNVAANAGFEEDPAEGHPVPGWHVFSTRHIRMAPAPGGFEPGVRALRISAQEVPGELQGLLQSVRVEEGDAWSFSASIRNDRDDPLGGSAYGLLMIEWKDAEGRIVKKVRSTPWSVTLSKTRWEMFSIRNVRAPRGAEEANFVLHFGEGDRGARGSLLVDDVRIEVQAGTAAGGSVARISGREH